jgi:hypothetical protein
MIIANIIGGLGNQMFQYACGRALSLRNCTPLQLATDQFDQYGRHNGAELLKVFDINVTVAKADELALFMGIRSNPKVRRLLGHSLFSWMIGGNWCSEPHFDYWPGIQQVRHPVYLQGYWQSEMYFSEVADVIRQDFTFRGELDALDLSVRKRMASGPCASLHVRRGDYLKGKFKRFYASCSVGYYVDAVRLLRDRFPGIRLFAFSDEPDWVARHLAPEIGSIEIVSHNSGVRSANDMRLMSLADHHVIANSSFSWWAAWLNPRKEKLVIAPKTWFADGRQTPTLLPSSWVTIAS